MLKVGLIFGGKSVEHEISLRSFAGVIEAIDREKYELVLIGVDKEGRWLLVENSEFLVRNNSNISGRSIAFVPQGNGRIVTLDGPQSDIYIDVALPLMHGFFGEDGTVQGLLKIANVPFVGVSVLGSAVSKDKDIMKRLLREAGIPTAKYIAAKESNVPTYEEATEKLGLPLFVKPANLGSSVGVNKVKDKEGFVAAIREAFSYDRKILIEEYVEGRELECPVLGNDEPIAALAGADVSNHEFFSYKAKYLASDGVPLELPAKLPNNVMRQVQDLAVKAFKTLECEGMGRVDFFLKQDGELLVNELNTIPVLALGSTYPKLWELSGISYPELIDRLIQLALERFEKEQKLKTSYGPAVIHN